MASLQMFPADAILSFAHDSDYGIYSNFYPVVVKLYGLQYPSVEHAYQAAKTKDLVAREQVVGMTAVQAKKWGRSIALRADWDEARIPIMYDLLKQKFLVPATDTSASRKLWLTGDRLLVEGNYWHDTFWGKCNCSRHNWTGENYLGRLLMKIRREIGTWPIWDARRGEHLLTIPYIN